MIKLKLSKNV